MMATLGTQEKITYFGQTDYRGKRIKFGIKEEDRWKHMYVIGKTGMGKSTMLENLAVQDIQNGEGVCFIDPHGGSAELLPSYVPEERIKDVVYFAPFDYEHPIALNVMEDIGRDKRPLVASNLIGAMKKVWVDAWSPRMEYLLSNALLALLEYPNSTLLGVNRMFADKDYRAMVVGNVTDPSVRAFWVDEFAKYSDKFATEATAAIQNKIGQFAANPLIRNIVGQPKSSIDIRKLMDEKKILIINLSKGRIGEGNANLLGAMIITKIYLAAMSRADTTSQVLRSLPPFYLYVDEFQSFANESFADILSEARKYKLSLTIAHQYIEQMSEEVRAAVFGNVGTMVTFRVGAYDAEVLEKEFSPTFTIEDIVNLGARQIYLKLMINGQGSAPFSATTLPPISPLAVSHAEEVIAMSRAQFARPRAFVEEEIKKWHEPVPPPPRDQSAPPETKKYAPGTRPPRTGEGFAPRSSEAGVPRYPVRSPVERSFGPAPDLGAKLRAVIPPPAPPPASRVSVAPEPRATSAPEFAPRPTVMPVPKKPAPDDIAIPAAADVPAEESSPAHRPFAQAFSAVDTSAQISSPPPAPQSSAPSFPAEERRLERRDDDRRRQDNRRHEERRNEERRYGDRRSPTASARPERPEGFHSAGASRSAELHPARTPRPAPLSALKSDPKRDKGPSAANLSELKSALRFAASQPPPASVASGTPISDNPPPRVDDSSFGAPALPLMPKVDAAPRFFSPESSTDAKPKEVPEDVLRNILG